jgi:hypothetical protein
MLIERGIDFVENMEWTFSKASDSEREAQP